MYKTAAVHSQEGGKARFWMLDGDKKKPTFDTSLFAVRDSVDKSFIADKVKESTGVALDKMSFRIDGNATGGNKEQLRLAAITYLGFIHSNFDYLPGDIPEETIWNEDFVVKHLDSLGVTAQAFGTDYKENILIFAELVFDDRTEASNDSAKKLLIKEMLRNKGPHYQELVASLRRFETLIEI